MSLALLVASDGGDTQEFNGDVAIGLVILLIIGVLVWGPSVIALTKGHIIWGVLGIVIFAPIGWVGAFLLAKPNSWWSRNRYDDAKRAEALEKYGEPVRVDQPAAPPPGAPVAAAGGTTDDGDWECGICGERSATKVAAEAHVRGAHPQAPVESSVQPFMG